MVRYRGLLVGLLIAAVAGLVVGLAVVMARWLRRRRDAGVIA
jgi:ABC-type nitrate/sulfonate/bicarbonate transport system permease component